MPNSPDAEFTIYTAIGAKFSRCRVDLLAVGHTESYGPISLGDKGQQGSLLVAGELHLPQVMDEEVKLSEHRSYTVFNHSAIKS